MVRVRLSRGGAKKKPYYHIVVIDKREKRDGKCLERIGSYDPSLETEDRIKLNHERLNYWIEQGAQISDRVKYLRKYSLDSKNLQNREEYKTKELEKVKIRKAKKAEIQAEEKPKEEVKAESKEEVKEEKPKEK
ncbi:MAG: 30S ribosomal protein S16 [Pseudomonadota bacterium]|nr:30S ribosomal protein S16 [Pseudomonadota bacterium]